jgi:phenylpropionate dioxygenase-like ring-hydroxylating dioxygenase large terminal subunit
MLDERQLLVKLAERLLAHHAERTTGSAPEPHRLDNRVYTDPELFARERQTIFQDNPMLVGFSADLPEPGSFFTFDDLGVPILLTRDRTGKVNAFLNACAHRGARLKDGCGKTAALACPYHAWSYDLQGRLVGIYAEPTFGRVDKSQYNLVRMPVEEKYGMIYVGASPDLKFTIDGHLGDLAAIFELWQLGKMQLVGEHKFETKNNWKLTVDTFFEGYHFSVVHRESVGDYAFGNLSAHDSFGPHQRLAYPNKSLLTLRDLPQEQWTTAVFDHFQLIHFLYPNVSLLVSPTAVEFFQFYPGPSVGECVSRYRCYWRADPSKADQGRDPREHFKWVVQVVGEEDYKISQSIQKGLETGLRPFNTLGRNEPALIKIHEALARGAQVAQEGARQSCRIR